MKDYPDLYLKCNVLLVADVFERFRNNNRSHFLSAPGLSWDAMLKMTKIKLEFIPDPDIYILFKKCKSRWNF